MKKAVLMLLFGGMAFAMALPSAHAIPPFSKEFVAMYVKEKPESTEEKALAAEVEKAKCNVCHVGKDKKTRNEYGKALDVLLDKKTDAKEVEKIKASLKKVESERSDPKDPKSPTFGELIKAGKLPGGEVK
jgi:hypothetical protein